jgi:U3 small nucleolar RNA-associated protein 20
MKGLTPQEALAKRAAKPLLAKGHHFKWHSQSQQMKEMTVDMQRVRERRDMLEGEDEAGEDETHSLFGTALGRSSLINLSLPFIAFSRSIEPKTRSLPLVIHHREAIVEAVCRVLRSSAHDIELCGETILE